MRLAGDAPARAVAAPVAVAADDPIAIVGMACRYPGGVRSPEDLWRVVSGGLRRDRATSPPTAAGTWTRCTTRIPSRPGRPTRATAGSSTTRRTSTPSSSGSRRARRWRWTRSSGCCWRPPGRPSSRPGIDPQSLRGSETGVFAGRHVRRLRRPVAARARRASRATSAPAARAASLSGRVAYTFGLEGPAVTVDTACSSSLVAMHLAAQALRAGECSLALAGGVTVMATPTLFVEFSRQRGLAPDGRCKPFAGAADGTGWAEGAGLVLLERLSDAQRLGHPVLAVRARHRGQPGRRVQRPDRAERPVAGARDPPGAGHRRSRPRRRRRRSRRTAPARARATRSRRRRCSPPTGRTGRDTAVAGFGEVEHRAHPGGRRRRRRDQDGAGDAARCAARDAARGRADPARRLVGRHGLGC